jgi:uncharacterized membrane protein YidH (DUF202 family)
MESSRFFSWLRKHIVIWNAGTAVLWFAVAIAQVVALVGGEGRTQTTMFLLVAALVACVGATVAAISFATQERRQRRSDEEPPA